MEKSKVDMFIGMNAECFEMQNLANIRITMENMDEAKYYMIAGAEFQKPTTILIIAIVLGWDRFFLGDTGMGILKVITCYGCLIWWIIDIFSAKTRTKEYNLKKFYQISSM